MEDLKSASATKRRMTTVRMDGPRAPEDAFAEMCGGKFTSGMTDTICNILRFDAYRRDQNRALARGAMRRIPALISIDMLGRYLSVSEHAPRNLVDIVVRVDSSALSV